LKLCDYINYGDEFEYYDYIYIYRTNIFAALFSILIILYLILVIKEWTSLLKCSCYLPFAFSLNTRAISLSFRYNNFSFTLGNTLPYLYNNNNNRIHSNSWAAHWLNYVVSLRNWPIIVEYSSHIWLWLINFLKVKDLLHLLCVSKNVEQFCSLHDTQRVSHNWYFHKFFAYLHVTLALQRCDVDVSISGDSHRSDRLKLKFGAHPRIHHTRGTHVNESSILEFNDYPVSKFNSSCWDDEGGERKITARSTWRY